MLILILAIVLLILFLLWCLLLRPRRKSEAKRS